MAMIGMRLREARETRGLSLTDVATKAHVSAATLSRIENNKQGLDFALFLVLAKVLAVSASDLVDDDGNTPHDPLVTKIAQLATTERVRLWRDLAEARRNSRQKKHARGNDTASQQMEELHAQLEYMREEFEAVRASMRKRGRIPRLTISSSE